jgi:hypothetical protein
VPVLQRLDLEAPGPALQPVAARVDFEKFKKAQSAALGVYEYLNESDANVALVGRIGSDKSDRGILYTCGISNATVLCWPR